MDASIYLDHAATTPIAPEVLAVVTPLLSEAWGNPSSHHALGRRARTVIDEARATLAGALGCRPTEIVFTSGGSEADNLALRGPLDVNGGGHLVVSAIEHDAVLTTAQALAARGRCTLTVVGCDRQGRVDPAEVAAAVHPGTVLASIMLANNETGVIQDVAAISEAVRQRNRRTLVHTDAVQALGKIPIDTSALGVDLLTITGHKIYGPKGAGGLWVRRGTQLAAQIDGGSQERSRRAGTENVAAIAGFAAATRLVEGERTTEAIRVRALSDRLVHLVLSALPDVILAGQDAERLPSFATFAIPGAPTDVLVTRLDRAGVAASGGSACSSGAAMPSHVLAAMGLPPHLAGGALRLTLGRGTGADEIESAAVAIIEAVMAIRSALEAGAALAG